MAHGGKRGGAGRKPGSTTKRTRQIADAAAAEGITPLEVLLQTMRQHWADGRRDDASKIAEKAAPYMHPRLASVEMGGPGGGPMLQRIERVIVDPANTDASGLPPAPPA